MVTNKLFARLSAIGLLVMGLFCMPRLGAAHPMGNFSINHFSALEVHPTLVRLHYVIDMAEIPTFQEMQEYGIMARPDEPNTIAYRERKVEELRQGLVLRTGDSVLPLTLQTSEISFPPGAGDLPTLRLAMVYEAPLTAETGELVALLTVLKKIDFDLSMLRVASRRHIFEAHVNGFTLVLQVHGAKPFDDLAQQASVRLG